MFKVIPSIWGDFEQKEILLLEKTYSNFSCQNGNNLWHAQIKQMFLHNPGHVGRKQLSIKASSLNIRIFHLKIVVLAKKEGERKWGHLKNFEVGEQKPLVTIPNHKHLVTWLLQTLFTVQCRPTWLQLKFTTALSCNYWQHW